MGPTGVEEMNLLLSGFFQRYVSFEPIEQIELSGQLDGSWEVHIPQFSDLSRGLDQVSLAFSWQEEHEFTAELEQQLAAGGQPAKNIEEEIQNCKHCPEEAIEGQQYEDADGKRYQYENGQWLEHIWTAPMLEPIPVKADRITAEGSSFWDWAKIGAEIAIGFTPFGVILDVIDLGKAIAGGHPTDIAIAMIGFLPAGDLLKAGKKIGGGLEKMLKHTDELAPLGVQPPKLQAPPKELEKLKELQKQVPEGPKAAKETPAIQNNEPPKVETPKAEPPKLEEPQLKEPELKEEIPLEKELGKQEAPELQAPKTEEGKTPPKVYVLDDEDFVLLQKGKLGKYGEGDKIPKADYEKLIKEYKREQLAAKKLARNAKLPTTVEELIAASKIGQKTSGKSKQYERVGDFETANKEFDALNPDNIRPLPNEKNEGRIGTLKDGRTIIVRKKGNAKGNAHLEIQKGKRKLKFRYLDKK